MTVKSNYPYIPSFIKSAFRDAKPVQMTYSDFNMSDTNHEDIGSFKYDPLGYPLKSTQQLNLDWSQFENHCFFSSAEVKVNEAFHKIINGYPFDGSKKEVESFSDMLTGFERWVLDSFPKWQGALHFSGTQVGEDPAGGYASGLGTWISVKDKSGVLYPQLSKNNTGDTIMGPDVTKSFTIESFIHLPAIVNDTQVIYQKTSAEDFGITFHIEPSMSTSTCLGVFSVSSGSVRNSVSSVLRKGSYNHVCMTLNREDFREDTLQFYLNESLADESKHSFKFKDMGVNDSNLLIGTGSSFYSKNVLVTPTQTFSGTMDELRVFHSARDVKTQTLYSNRGIFSTPDLKLYYRFNEPSGSLSLNGDPTLESIVLDSSGNSLHSTIRNYDPGLRTDVSADDLNPLKHEKKDFQTVLFPAYAGVLELNASLLAAASNYDRSNPNNIIKLVPKHYLLEGAQQDGFPEVEGTAGDAYGGSGIPGQGKRGSAQIILTFLYIWAKFFDELKTYIDSFATLRTVKYDTYDSIPDNFIEDLIKYYGFELPKFFNHATVSQFAEGEYIEGITDVDTPLKKIQSYIVRRVLVNLPDIIRSKGTQHSIRSFLRSVGVDPDNSIRIREYGGPTIRQLGSTREKRFEPAALVDFVTSSLVMTQPLSASRVEPGIPEPVGSFYVDSTGRNAGTNYSSDGLLTSGSWHLEGMFKIPPQKLTEIVDIDGNQSLLRLVATGSNSGVDPGLVVNVVASQYIEYPKTPAMIHAFFRPGVSSTSPVLEMSMDLRGHGLFDGDKWNVAVGCIRNDEIDSVVSSSYYLRVAKTDSGDITEAYVTSSFFYEKAAAEDNALRDVSATHNASGSYIEIGGGRTFNAAPGYSFLNDTLTSNDIARTTDYAGWAGNLRFWSKSMSMTEWKEHARNPKSLGVDDPLKNYNFVKNVEGSFRKLRLDTLQKQPERYADSNGDIRFLDFSLNSMLTTTGSGFATGSKVLVGDLLHYTYLSPMFDEAATDDKIRIRSFQDANLLAENPYAVATPTYLSNQFFLQEEPQDDLRLSIEFSMVDSLDRDMVNMFSSFDFLNDALGSPENMFSPDYPDLDRLRDVYFNRLSGKPDFRKFLEFYRWFDVSISTFVDQLIPSKTNYKGTNFVVESHLLERHKNSYRHSNNYLGNKEIIEDSLLVQQIVGKIGKY